jgi:hypothetical protein
MRHASHKNEFNIAQLVVGCKDFVMNDDPSDSLSISETAGQ